MAKIKQRKNGKTTDENSLNLITTAFEQPSQKKNRCIIAFILITLLEFLKTTFMTLSA